MKAPKMRLKTTKLKKEVLMTRLPESLRGKPKYKRHKGMFGVYIVWTSMKACREYYKKLGISSVPLEDDYWEEWVFTKKKGLKNVKQGKD